MSKSYPLSAVLHGAEAVLWDMDGVLLDTEVLYTEAIRTVLGERADEFTWRIKEQMMGRKSLDAGAYLIKTLGLSMSPEEYLERRQPILHELFSCVPEKPGAGELVTQLVALGVPQAVATSSERSLFERKSNPHPWFEHFAAVVCGSDSQVKAHKPAPDIFLAAAQALDVPPQRCIIFEDSPAGVAAARAAGALRVVGVADPNIDKSLLGDADLVIESYEQLTR